MKQPLILGLGKTGISLVAYFAQRDYVPVVVDTRQAPALAATLTKHFPQAQLLTPDHPQLSQRTFCGVWASPGFPLRHPLLDQLRGRGYTIESDISLFAHQLYTTNPQAQVVAITGTNGKSTVCSMLAHALHHAGIPTQLAGNIGLPVVQLLGEPQNARYYILELSSFQLMYPHGLHRHSGCILNFAPDHLDSHHSLREYAAAKQNIYRGSAAQITNLDDAATQVQSSQERSQVYSFSLAGKPPHNLERCAWYGNGQLFFGDRCILSAHSLTNRSKHNINNTLATLALLASINQLSAATHLQHFEHLAHRCQFVGEKYQRSFVNDSKATNPHAAIHSLDGLSDQYPGLVIIAGGDAKGLALDTLGQAISQHCRAGVLIGTDALVLQQHCTGVSLAHADTMEQAVRCALDLSQPGDCIVLCPGCASTDMFSNYEHRGDAFVQAIDLLEGDTPC